MQQLMSLAERGSLPDWLVRQGIRRLLRQRLSEIYAGNCEDWTRRYQALLRDMADSPVAPSGDASGEQWHGLPAAFFELVLGRRLKHSCCEWTSGVGTLDVAEEMMLATTCRRAGLVNGENILELGCGWGSLALWVAEQYPDSYVTAVTHSAEQRDYIEQRRRDHGLINLEVITADLSDFHTDERFHRVLAVESFAQLRNWSEMLRRVATLLEPGGALFIQTYCHREHAYLLEREWPAGWMGGFLPDTGLMPSDTLLLHFQQHLHLERHWRVSGRHYQSTADAWLARMDDKRAALERLFAGIYGPEEAERRIRRWRVFLMACSELFGHDDGNEWFVGQYRFRAPVTPARPNGNGA
jgi:cyclopropane-fatty-acyl-phospholipid synthase